MNVVNVKMMKMLSVVVALSVLSVSNSWSATIPIIEGFETVAGSPDGLGDFDPADLGNPFHPGGVNEFFPTQVQVLTPSAPGPGAAVGDQYLKVSEGSFYEPWISGGGLTADFSVEFYVNNPNTAGFNFQLGKRNNLTQNSGYLGMKWDGGDIHRLIDGRTWHVIQAFTPGVWDKYRVDIHWATSTFDFYVNDAQVFAGIVVTGPGVTPVDNVFFGTRANANMVYVDGISIVPEPATLTLLALGLPALLRRKKKVA